jgi:hypothetical protein
MMMMMIMRNICHLDDMYLTRIHYSSVYKRESKKHMDYGHRICKKNFPVQNADRT